MLLVLVIVSIVKLLVLVMVTAVLLLLFVQAIVSDDNVRSVICDVLYLPSSVYLLLYVSTTCLCSGVIYFFTIWAVKSCLCYCGRK